MLWHFRNDINLKATHVLEMAYLSLTQLAVGSKRFSDTSKFLASVTNITYSESLKSCLASGTADDWNR